MYQCHCQILFPSPNLSTIFLLSIFKGIIEDDFCSVNIDMAPLGIWMPSRVTTSRARNPAVHIRGGCSLVAWLCQVTQRFASSDDMLLRTIMYVTGAGPMFLRFPVLYLYSISRNFCVRGRFPALQERLLCCPQSLLFFYSHSSAF